MYTYLHDQFQLFLDKTIEMNINLSEKKEIIKQHLLYHQSQYQEMLLSFFEGEELTKDNYFYITYTYKDLPIDMTKQNEIVVSFLYELDTELYYELVVFNEGKPGEETRELFSQSTHFYS